MKNLCLIIIMGLISPVMFSQVAINSGGGQAAASAMLDVGSTEKGLLVPRMTGVQRDLISEPATGLLIFCTDDNQFYLNRGTPSSPAWTALNTQWTVDGSNIYYNAGRVGIGTDDPRTSMDISGFLRLSPVICEMVCGGDLQGTIYYDSFYNKICYCNGAHWMMLDGGGYCECVDLDGDNYDNCDPEHPYDTDGMPADCDDANDNIYPGNTEYCDGLDNDCNPGSPDGSTDPNIGMACDGPDSDLCQEGVFVCVAGQLECSDNTGNNLDVCDGIDNDCDPASADGSEDPLVGSPCDGPDSDLCQEGVYVCSGGMLQCTDNTGNNAEICDDNIDNDCDGLTDSEDPDCQ